MAGKADVQVEQQVSGDRNAEETTNGCILFLNGLFCFFCVLTGQFFVDSATLQERNGAPGGDTTHKQKGGYV